MSRLQLEAVIALKVLAEHQLKKLSKDAAHAAASIGRLEDEVEGAGKASKKAGREQGALADETKKAGDEALRSAKKFEESGSKLDGFKASANTFAKVGLAAAGAGMFALAKGSIDAVAELETFGVQLEVLLKDSTLAEERLEQLFKIGSTTPFELGDLVRADVIIQGFGADANELRMGIMDLAGALNTDLPTAATAVAKAFAVGKAGSDGLKESYALLYTDILKRAKEMGDPKDIKIWQAAMTQALQAVDGVVAGGTAKLAKTFRGKMSNMSDAWFKLKVSIGKSGLFDFVSTGLKVMLGDLDNASDGVDKLGKAISDDLILAIEGFVRVGALAAQAMLALASGAEFLIAGFHAVVTIFHGIRTAIAGANLAFVRFLDSIRSTEQSRENIARLSADFQAAGRAALEAGDSMTGALERIDRMGRTMGDLGGVGDKLDEIRQKADALRASAAKGVKINIETTTTTTGPAGGMLSEADMIDILTAPDSATTTTTTTGAGGGGGGGAGTTKKSAGVAEIERLQKLLEGLVPKETQTALEKNRDLLYAALDAQTKFGDKSLHDFGALMDQIDEVGEELKDQQKIMEEANASEDMFALVREIDALAPAARKAAQEVAGTWTESDTLAEKIKKAKDQLSGFRERMILTGVSTSDAADGLAALGGNITALKAARDRALEEERLAARDKLSIHRRMWSDLLDFTRAQSAAFGESVGAGMKSLGGSVLSGLGSMLGGVTSLGTGGIGSMLGGAGPVGGAIAGISQLGSMGYTKTEEFIDPRTGEKKTRDVEVSGGEAIGEQMEAFLDGLISGLVDVLPDLIGTIIPNFIAEGVPALIEGLIQAIPAIVKAFIVDLPIALVRGLGEWWDQIWDGIKAFFKSIGKAGGGALAGGAAGAGIGFAFGGPVGAAIGAGIGAIGGALFGSMHEGGVVDRTGPMLLQQGERIVPNSGAGTQAATSSGLGAFGIGGGANVTINTNIVDNDSIDRLGQLLDEHYGSNGRNTAGIFGG